MRTQLLFSAVLILATAFGCDRIKSEANAQSAATQTSTRAGAQQSGQPEAPPVPEGMEAAILAGGCFWCMEGPLEALDGVSEVVSGYAGGDEVGPTYRQVSSGQTGHTEAVRVVFDPDEISYSEILHKFWKSMDPTDSGGQFADRGSQYRPAIFYLNEEQRRVAEESKRELEESGHFDEPIVVPIVEATPFYVAEAYHQNYYRTNRAHYQRYYRLSGREAFLERTWGDHEH